LLIKVAGRFMAWRS